MKKTEGRKSRDTVPLTENISLFALVTFWLHIQIMSLAYTLNTFYKEKINICTNEIKYTLVFFSAEKIMSTNFCRNILFLGLTVVFAVEAVSVQHLNFPAKK
jgi:hypothetical protein